ncbi:MAG: hypothetical protein AAFZ09_10590, partial [Pseudomonadota bacterium]
ICVQIARATRWRATDNRLHALIEPYTTEVEVTFVTQWPEKAGALAGMPLGGYTLDWPDFEEEPYFGDAALEGLGGCDKPAHFKIEPGDTLKRMASPSDESIVIRGFAADLYRVDGAPQRFDTRGFGLADRLEEPAAVSPAQGPAIAASFGAGLRLRRGRILGTTGGELWLATLDRAVEAAPGADSGATPLTFWFRDIPIAPASAGGEPRVFEAFTEISPNEFRFNRIEAALGPRVDLHDREHAPTGLHEWRLCEEGSGRYDIGLGPLRFRPLRLLRLDLPSGEIQVLGSIALSGMAAGAGDASIFADDRPYETGNLATLDLQVRGGVLAIAEQGLRRVRLKRTSADEHGAPGFFVTEVHDDPVIFDLDCTIRLARVDAAGELQPVAHAVTRRQTVRHEVTLSSDPTAPVRHEQVGLRLFGSDTELDLGSGRSSDAAGIHVTHAALKRRAEDGAHELRIVVEARLPLRPPARASAVPDAVRLAGDGTIGCLGFSLAPDMTGSDGNRREEFWLDHDHERGVLRF